LSVLFFFTTSSSSSSSSWPLAAAAGRHASEYRNVSVPARSAAARRRTLDFQNLKQQLEKLMTSTSSESAPTVVSRRKFTPKDHTSE